MAGLPLQPSLLTRDRKLFLELSPEEADRWIACVFDAIRPQMHLIRAMLFEGDDLTVPLNLEVVMMVAGRRVREVAVTMARELFTPERQQQILPPLNAYCDELLARGRGLDAAFVQQSIIGMVNGQPPEQNTLLIEICLHCLTEQVGKINGDPQKALQAH